MILHANRLMKYHALFVIFEKATKFEIVVCFKHIGGALKVKIDKRPSINTNELCVQDVNTLENPCTRKAQSSRGGHSRRVEKNGVFMYTLLLKKVIHFLTFCF